MLFHIRIFLQTLRRNVTYSAINISGLAIGITASVLIFFWVRHERTFDTHYPDAERIYRIITTIKSPDGDVMAVMPITSLPFIRACENEIPEIENTAFLINAPINAVTINNTVFSVKQGEGGFVNRAWLEMFHSLLDGSLEAFGAHPFSVALSESEAKKFFGDERAVGKIIRINDADYTVQAVVKDNPSNSSFRFNIMASSDALMEDPNQRQMLERWTSMNWMAFVKLRSDANVSLVAEKMTDIYDKNIDFVVYTASLELVSDMYFSDIMSLTQGNARMVSIFALLGILLLFTGCINYINLTTAKATLRAKEVGMKKIVGAKSRTLFFQFIAESFIVSLIATVVALYLILVSIPLFQKLVGDIPVSFSSPTIWVITAIALAFVTIMNGIYPALVLTSFQPINILKGASLPKIKDSNLRRVLVVFQFTLSAALIVSVIVIFLQTQFILNTDPGFRKDNIVRAQLPIRTLMSSGMDNALFNLQTIKGRLQSLPNVVSVTLCNGNIENIHSRIMGRADWSGRAEDFNPMINILKVDEDFMNVFELQMIGGRWFDGDADMQNVILNETAIRELGIHEPHIGQRFDMMGMNGNIIGIVKDFHFRSRHEKIAPLIFFQQDRLNTHIAIKTHEGRSAEVVSALGAIWSDFFPNDPFEYNFVDDAFNYLYQSDIRTSRLLLTFSILAIVIAVLGLFGLSTFAIERRTKEIGIRKVLGASIANILNLLTREFLILVGVAFVIAAPLSLWAMSRWLENFAYRINITVWIFVAGAVATLVIALLAVGVQALRAALANPVKSIKSE